MLGALCTAGFALSAAPVPDAGARVVLQKYAEAGKNYTQRTGRTAIFARLQVKYGLQRSDYLQRWTDRPLWQDGFHPGAALPALSSYQSSNSDRK